MSGLTFVAAPAAPETFNVLLYGPPKAGKTTAAATAPGPIMWVNLEGPGALGHARRVAAQRGTVIHEVRPERTDKLRPVLDSVYQHVVSGAEPQVCTVVVDTLGKARDQLARNIGGDHPQIQHWGEVAKILEGFVVALRDRPVNLILIAHEAIKDSDAGDRIVEPLIGGATTAKVCGEVDVIAYCGRVEDDDGVRYMGVLTERKGRRAGDRSGALGGARELDLSEWLEVYSAALAQPGVDPNEPVVQPAPVVVGPDPALLNAAKVAAKAAVDAKVIDPKMLKLLLAEHGAQDLSSRDRALGSMSDEGLVAFTADLNDAIMAQAAGTIDEPAEVTG